MMPLPRDILQQIEDHFSVEYARVNMMPPSRSAAEIGDEQRILEQLTLMEDLIGEPVGGKRMLEAGSGIGLFQAVALTEGAHVFGIEPDPVNCGVSRSVMHHYEVDTSQVSQAYGERLPFADNVFDIVCSFHVLEHVRDLRLVLTESTRVLKPGGYLHCAAPSYGSIWEGHYNILWIPNSPRWLAKVYVRLLGRDPGLIDKLQFVTPGKLRRIVAGLPLQVKSWGVEVWEYRLDTLDFSEWSELRHLKTMVRWARRLRIVELVRLFGRRLDFFTPILLTAQKL